MLASRPHRPRPGPARRSLGLLVLLTASPLLRAQTLEDIREELRGSLREIHFAQSLMGLVLLAEELELSGAHYSLDNPEDTDLTVYAMPFHTSKPVWGEDRPRLHLEGAFGYAEARESVADFYGGALPGLETEVRTKWRTYGGLLGAGIEFPVATGWTVTPILDVGLSRIENDTNYGGPGAAVTAALADGIAFNWDAMAFTYGGAGRVDWRRSLDEHHKLEVVARYDVRWTETFAEDDTAQDFVARSQLITLHGEMVGPTGFDWSGRKVDWQAGAAYRVFPEGTLFGVDDYVQIGGGLLVYTGDRLPVGRGFAVNAAYMFAPDFEGWTVGFRVLF